MPEVDFSQFDHAREEHHHETETAEEEKAPSGSGSELKWD
jgi:hypothetical protein